MTHSARNGALIHYHEIALKGKNRGFFLKQLAANLRMASQDLAVGPLRRPAGLRTARSRAILTRLDGGDFEYVIVNLGDKTVAGSLKPIRPCRKSSKVSRTQGAPRRRGRVTAERT